MNSISFQVIVERGGTGGVHVVFKDLVGTSINMVAKIVLYPPDMAVTNFWDSMTIWMKSPNETLATVFRSNAAIWLAEHNRTEEMVPFTNSLPASAINILQEELE